ncbi:hypothetical protein PAXINDRAFT_87980 [Paxillus involutus ATCC 200175]|uniref:Uncharacterized protein n=1 Tax=Paxillus involutus ATCC 200175 TaxID=664439 RepID=A0A0C9TMT5_PAXIN|nr:hypothetical protein PAXINDRAFT_87980 [Paxillus involutus ATCC 200175]
MSTSEVEAPAIEDPAPSIDGTLSVNESSQKVTQSLDIEESIIDSVPDYESAPQSAVSQSSPVLVIPESASSISSTGPSDVAFVAPQSPSAPTEKGPVPTSSTSSPPEKAVIPTVVSTCEAGGTISITVPNPEVPVPSSAPETGIRSEGKRSFKAVVHRKVTEKPAVTVPASTLVAPPTPQVVRPRRSANSNVVEVPASPGYGDLAVLLEDAALLEMRLTEGDNVGSKAGGLLPPTPTSAIFMPDPRSASASTLTSHAPMTSTDSGSQSGRSVSIPSIREPEFDGEIPEEDETDGRSLASTTFSQRSPSHRKYLSSIRRLTGRRSSSYMPGAYPRDSMSMSSEDSSPVATPPDSGNGRAFGIAWPSGSPKRSGSGASRASSFADKIFHRNRTRSNVSTADPDRSSLYESSQPNLTLPFSPDVSPEKHRDGTDVGARPSSWISPRDSSSDFSPASSFLDKDIFDAFPSVPQTLPPGPLYLDPGSAGGGRAATLPVKGRKHSNQRLSMM